MDKQQQEIDQLVSRRTAILKQLEVLQSELEGIEGVLRIYNRGQE